MNVMLPPDIAASVTRALAEDVGSGDLTASLVPATAQATATVITREPAILCGRAWVDEVCRQVDTGIRVTWAVKDGDRVEPDQVLCRIEGPARAMLTAERPALNFLQTLSGTATITRRYVDAVAGTGCRILDTRKTIPGLRLAQKYAVHCAGGTNHRIGLYDGILIKENHIAAAGSIAAAVAAARAVNSQVLLEVEVESIEELQQAIATHPDRILIDNFTLGQMRDAVAITRAYKPKKIDLEASGNVTLETIRPVAETGVDFISIGSLTKHVRAIDLSMRFA
ncbi:MAG: carboxylating nicotinate-nucleotide diphosphorylase [Steroidobacteraceae bacterium]